MRSSTKYRLFGWSLRRHNIPFPLCCRPFSVPRKTRIRCAIFDSKFDRWSLQTCCLEEKEVEGASERGKGRGKGGRVSASTRPEEIFELAISRLLSVTLRELGVALRGAPLPRCKMSPLLRSKSINATKCFSAKT